VVLVRGLEAGTVLGFGAGFVAGSALEVATGLVVGTLPGVESVGISAGRGTRVANWTRGAFPAQSFLAAFVASCLLGAFPPVDFLAV